jgi:tetratricopeptide (TPR) repeat protein
MKFRYLYLVISLCFVFLPHNSLSQTKQLIINSTMQFEYAQKMFESQDYETAIVEFKRFIHFFPENENQDLSKFNIGVSYFNLKKYHDAAKIFNEIIIKSKKEIIVQKAVFFQSKAFLMLGNTGYAQIVLQNHLKLEDDIDVKDQIYFNLAQIQLSNARKLQPGSLERARQYLSKISPSNQNRYKIDQYDDLIFRAEHAPSKNPEAAGLFAIIPGGGFLYCERYHDALITFLLNTGLMLAAYEAWDHDNKALAGVIGFVETGFYTGNIYGSISSAHKFNQAQIIKILGRDISIKPNINPEHQTYGLSLNFNF